MLKALCELTAVSGYERLVIDYLYYRLEEIPYGKTYIDNVGNLIFFVRGQDSKKKVLIQAHVDEVGFQVVSRIEKGKYSIKSLGNIKTWNAHQQRVMSDRGISGVIYAKDGEQLKPYNYDNLVLDICDSELSESVETGDVFAFCSPLQESKGRIIGKALDNRVSCYCLMEAISKCDTLKNDTYFCFSVMEETNMRGVRVLKSTIQPDICISVDASGIGERNSLKLGGGVGIKISDGMGISTVRAVKRAESIATENCIKYQLEVSDGGTSELIISNELDNGCDELGVSIPCSYMHSANSIMSMDDVNECCKLLPVLLASI